jgi:hypothetical protein
MKDCDVAKLDLRDLNIAKPGEDQAVQKIVVENLSSLSPSV